MSRLRILNLATKLRSWLDQQAKLRKDEFVANAPMSRPIRIGGALIPTIAFFTVVYIVYGFADKDRIVKETGVQLVDDWKWDVSLFDIKADEELSCHADQCWQNLSETKRVEQVTLPANDPIGQRTWEITSNAVVTYSTTIPLTLLEEKDAKLLYIPGIVAKHVSVWFNGKTVINSPGNLPYFANISSNRKEFNHLVIAATLPPNASFSGLLKTQPLLVGGVGGVRNTHTKLLFRSFPRNAVVIFLLSIGALTFAFFIFLDHKRELFALGSTISLLGAAYAIRVGISPYLSAQAFFGIFALHVTALTWYASELIRINVGWPKKIFAAGAGVIAAYYLTLFVTLSIDCAAPGGAVASGYCSAIAPHLRPFRIFLLLFLDFIPIILGLLCIIAGRVFWSISRERSTQLLISSLGMLCYGFYLLGNDIGEYLGVLKEVSRFVKDMHQIPLMGIVTSWIITALSSLGSLEKRVQIGVKDREQRLKLEHEIVLAQEVQESFINSGTQPDELYEVCTIYQAVKKVGGDWVTWKPLNDQYSIGIIGDVVGKGVQAGLVVSACDSILRHRMPILAATENLQPEMVIRDIVESIQDSVIAPHERRAMTLAVLVAQSDGLITYTCLGHPPLLAVSEGGIRVFAMRNSWLSPTFDARNIKIGTIELNEEETIIGYTDGVCDGSRELRKFRKRISSWHERTLSEIESEFLSIIPDYDDQTLILIRRKAVGTTSEVKAS